MRARRRRLVDMKQLRVIAHGIALDVVDGEAVPPELAPVANPDVLEKSHREASGARRPNMMELVCSITVSPF